MTELARVLENTGKTLQIPMQPKAKNTDQLSFYRTFDEQLNPQHPLYQLANKIDWKRFEEAFRPLYHAKTGRPAKPIRLMVGLLILKHVRNISDEHVVAQWEENAYYQYFCGETSFVAGPPCEASELVHFRHRIGQDGLELILQESIRIQNDDRDQDNGEVIVDTTVQEKNITFPTDDKLRKKIVRKCLAIAKQEGLALRQTYTRTIQRLSYQQRFRRTKAQQAVARRADRRIHTIANRLVSELRRKLDTAAGGRWNELLTRFERVLRQKRTDKNKIYSLHEPNVQCIAKGKTHKPYEFGSKASFLIGKHSGIVLGALNLEKNDYDGHTLEPALEQYERWHGQRPSIAIGDLGYRGRAKIGTTKVLTPASPGATTPVERRKRRRSMRRRAAIEAAISLLKRAYRLNRNYYKGTAGDHTNVLLAAAAANFARWMRRFFAPIQPLYYPCVLLVALYRTIYDQINDSSRFQLGGPRGFRPA
jgi:IS5 family transposase